MDREKAKKFLAIYGNPTFNVGKTKLSFSRQNISDIEEIENMSDEELMEQYKSLIFVNFIYGSVSLNEMQRIDLMDLEITERDIFEKESFDAWFKEESESFAKLEEEVYG